MERELKEKERIERLKNRLKGEDENYSSSGERVSLSPLCFIIIIIIIIKIFTEEGLSHSKVLFMRVL